MFGVMGIGSAFINAAGRGGKKKPVSENIIKLVFETEDPTIYRLSCTGTINIVSQHNGEELAVSYSDLNNAEVSVQADANTEIVIKGDVTKIQCQDAEETEPEEYVVHGDCEKSIESTSGALELYTISKSHEYDLGYNRTRIIKLNCPNLQYINGHSDESEIETLDLRGCNSLKSMFGAQTQSISKIYYAANNQNVSVRIASLIEDSESDSGTVYTDSAGAYYSTIADAATAKGWTIEQL